MEVGEVYQSNADGPVEVIEYRNAFEVRIRFTDTGNTRFSQAVDIRLGRCKDRNKPNFFGVGFVSYGPHRTKSKAGLCWSGMMRRCYDPKWKSNKPSYDGVVVCDQWHNLQNFAEWFYANHPDDGLRYDLDKDKLIPGAKVYSPSTCSFISHAENVALQAKGGFSMRSPDGELVFVSNAKSFCRENGLDRSNLNKVMDGKVKHVKGWTYEDITGR